MIKMCNYILLAFVLYLMYIIVIMHLTLRDWVWSGKIYGQNEFDNTIRI